MRDPAPRPLPARLPAIAPDPRTALSGILIVLAFPPWGLTPLIWICLVPWLGALERAGTARRAMREGVWLSVVMSVLGFYWVAFVLQEFGQVPWPVAIA